MTTSRRWIAAAVAAVFGIAAGAGVHYYIADRVAAIEAGKARTEFVKQIVPNQDMPRGSKLTADTVSIRSVPREWAYPGALTPDQLDRFENSALDVPARRGQPILWSQLASARPAALSDRIEAGRRAVTVPVDDVSSLSGMVTPGDRIDLLVSIKRNAHATLMPVLQRAVVLATGMRTDARAAQDGHPDLRGYTTITLDVSPEEARRLFAAREIGRLTAVLRASSDNAEVPMANADALTLLGLSSTAAPAFRVPVIYADQLARNSSGASAAGFSR